MEKRINRTGAMQYRTGRKSEVSDSTKAGVEGHEKSHNKKTAGGRGKGDKRSKYPNGRIRGRRERCRLGKGRKN